MFNKNFIYEKNKIDLMSLINEFLLQTTFEILNFSSIACIKEMNSNSNKQISINQLIDQSIY